MSFLDVVFRALNKAGDEFIEARREDGHGSAPATPTHVNIDPAQVDELKQQTGGLTDAQLRLTPVKVDDDETQNKLQAIKDAQLADGHGVSVNNQPTDYPDSGTHDRVDAVTGECRTGEKAMRVVPCVTPEDNGTKFFFNDEFGVNMNQDGAGAASLVESDFIHGGGPTGEAVLPEVAWTPSQTTGSGANFNSTQFLFDPPPQGGTFYHDLRGATDESVWQFVADQAVPASTHLEFYLYVQRWENQNSRQIEMRLKNGATDVGFVQLRNYIDRTGSLNRWQLVRIPLADFAPTGVWDTLEFTLKHQRIDICTDGLRLLNTAVESSDIVYEIAPDDGDILIIDTLRFAFVDQVAVNPANGAPIVNYDALGAIPALANGLLYQRITDGEVTTSFAVRRLWDLLRVPGTTLETHFGGTTGDTVIYMVTSHFARPLVLNSANGDKLRYTLRDDLSGLNELNVSVGAGRVAI